MTDPTKTYLNFIFKQQTEGVVDSHLILIALVKQYCKAESVQREQRFFSNYLTKLSPDHPKKLLHRLYHHKNKNIIRAFLSVFGDYEIFVPPKTLQKLAIKNVWQKSYEALLLKMFKGIETCFDRLEDVFIPANMTKTLWENFLLILPSLNADKIYTACALLQMLRDYLPKEESDIQIIIAFLRKAASHGYSYNSNKALETIAVLRQYLPKLTSIKMELLQSIVHGVFHPCALDNDRLSQWMKLSKIKYLFDYQERQQILNNLFLLIKPEITSINLLDNETISLKRENRSSEDLYRTYLFEAILGLRSWIERGDSVYDRVNQFLLQMMEVKPSLSEKIQTTFFGKSNAVVSKQLQTVQVSNKSNFGTALSLLSDSEKVKAIVACQLESHSPAVLRNFRESLGEMSQDFKIALMAALLNNQKINPKSFMMVYTHYRRVSVDAALLTQPVPDEMIEAIKHYRY